MLSVREEFRLESVKYFDIGGGFFGAAPYVVRVSSGSEGHANGLDYHGLA